MENLKTNYGLVFTGGGARAAYQVGVLKGLADLFSKSSNASRLHDYPFSVVTGESAGAINSTYMASSEMNFTDTASYLWENWENLKIENVFRTDPGSLIKIGGRWIKDLSLGGILGKSRSISILDPSPLKDYLGSKINFNGIQNNIQKGRLYGAAISATNFATGTAISFFDGNPSIQPWYRSLRMGKRTKLGLEYVLASAAIPLIFPPVKLHGSFYGDGSVRMKAPLSPAIHLGSDKVFAIGVRHYRESDRTRELNEKVKADSISLADIVGVMLNAAFLDSLDEDLERMTRINRTLELIPKNEGAKMHLKPVPVFGIRPSCDLGTLASEQFNRFSPMIRYLLKGLGASQHQGWDLLSYLAFDEIYTKKLLNLGYDDLMDQKEAVKTFFEI